MPNQASKADHIPTRTCIVCRAKRSKEELLSFFLLEGGLVLDLTGKLQTRKNYVCDRGDCLGNLDKWKLRYKKKLKVQKAKPNGVTK